jgi:hypothetical protein
MKALSPAQQIFVLHLTKGCGMHLPTALAIEGGQILVDQTVRAMQALFPATKP